MKGLLLIVTWEVSAITYDFYLEFFKKYLITDYFLTRESLIPVLDMISDYLATVKNLEQSSVPRVVGLAMLMNLITGPVLTGKHLMYMSKLT